MVQTRVTFDVSKGGKVKADGATAMIRHWARDVDAENDIYRPHSNKGIDASRSLNNETWFPTDGPRSDWVRPGSTEEIEARLDARLAEVTGRTRKDSVVMRGVVLGLSPEWVEKKTPNWKTDPRDRAKFMDTLQPVVDRVIEEAGGPKNVILVTGHFDEVAPQIQMAITPVTEDGRLRQNDFDLFRSPKHLGALHKKIRRELKESGVDVILESSERSREHLSNLEYARKADKERAEEIEELGKQRQQIVDERKQLDEDKAELPKLRQQAFSEGRKQGRQRGEVEGYAKGFEEGQVEAGARIAEAEQQARDIVQQAQETLRRLRDENERLEQENAAKRSESAQLDVTLGDKRANGAMLDAEISSKRSESKNLDVQISSKRSESESWDTSISVKRGRHENLDKTLRDKRRELDEVQAELDTAELWRDSMTQFGSDFIDHAMQFPGMPEEFERFKVGRIKGYPAAVDGTKEYYERTVAENKRRRQSQGGGNGQPQGQGQLGGGKGKPKGGGNGGGNGQLGE